MLVGLQGQAGVHRQRSKRRGRSGVRWREEEGKEGDEANRWGRAISETGKRAGDARGAIGRARKKEAERGKSRPG